MKGQKYIVSKSEEESPLRVGDKITCTLNKKGNNSEYLSPSIFVREGKPVMKFEGDVIVSTKYEQDKYNAYYEEYTSRYSYDVVGTYCLEIEGTFKRRIGEAAVSCMYVVKEHGNIKEIGKFYRPASPEGDKAYYEAFCDITLKNLFIEHKGYW
jgi:hypothetical protein